MESIKKKIDHKRIYELAKLFFDCNKQIGSKYIKKSKEMTNTPFENREEKVVNKEHNGPKAYFYNSVS